MFKFAEDLYWAQGLGQPRPHADMTCPQNYHFGSIHLIKGKHLRIEDKECPHEFDLEALEIQRVQMKDEGTAWTQRCPRHSLTGNSLELTEMSEGYDVAPKYWVADPKWV